MIFNSLEFLIFLPIVLVAYYLLPFQLQNVLLLVASYIFYGSWDWRFLSLLIISTITDFISGNCIYHNSEERKRKVFLLLSISVNLSILGFFKYYNFFIQSFHELLLDVGLGSTNAWVLNIVLPLGISFYTFQTMAYTIDIYRRKSQPTSNFLNFALYVTYFPQLVAGPIERATRLLPQLEKRREICPQTISSGIALVLTGFFKKVFIGDFFAAPYADLAFSDTSSCSPSFLMLGICMFSIQIYSDFSGYTDIARGVSRMLGIQLMMNFRQPYLSRNITEFWKRWHISLSQWLRDYLYIPLGGNRKGEFNTYKNLFITMLVGGLWHGAGWTFFVWGALHGFYLIVHKVSIKESKPDRSNISRLKDFLPSLWKIALTNILVLITWVFFRAIDLEHATLFISNFFIGFASPSILLQITLIFTCYLSLTFGMDYLFYRKDSDDIFSQISPLIRIPVYGLIILATWVVWPSENAPFIYFQF